MKQFYFSFVAMLFMQQAHCQAPQYEWIKTLEGANNDIFRAVTADLEGNYYVTFTTTSPECNP